MKVVLKTKEMTHNSEGDPETVLHGSIFHYIQIWQSTFERSIILFSDPGDGSSCCFRGQGQ